MPNTRDALWDKFRVSELEILRRTFWTWSVRPVQCVLGAGILSLNRPACRLGDLTPEEGAELSLLVRSIEHALSSFSHPDKYNYLALMMVDPQVHLHVLPRYESSREFGGVEWHDTGWPGVPALGDNADRSEPNVVCSVRDSLRQRLVCFGNE